MEVFYMLHSGYLDLQSVSRGWICLIPKKSAASEVRVSHPAIDTATRAR